MLIACGNRGFGLAQVRAWSYSATSGELTVWVGRPDPQPELDGGPLFFHDEEAAHVLEQLRRHAAAAMATLDAVESLQRADDPVA